MTNSTNQPQDPKVKKTGPLRLEAIIPVTVIVTLVLVFFTYFFDHSLRKGLEWTLTHVYGAEVNIGYIRTSFLRGQFKMGGLQMTDKGMPSRNLLQIGEIRFQFLWDALLRAKFVVDESSIENIQVYAPRKTPGFIIPPSTDKGPSALSKIQDEVLDQTQKEFAGNALGDLAGVLGGADPASQLKDLQTQLKSEERIKQVEKELKDKEKIWRERIDTLPQKKEFEALAQRAKGLKFDLKNPKAFADSTKELQKIIKEADEKVKVFERHSKDIQTDVKGFDNSFKQLDDLVEQDLKDLQARLKIPSLDVQDLSKNLFGKMIEKKLVSVKKYTEVAREYMPPKKTKEEKQPDLIPPPRGKGKNYRFPITTGYPTFWLKKAMISSEPGGGAFSGQIRGELRDLTTDPVALGRPTELEVAGDFPAQRISGLQAKLTMDHTTDNAKETLNALVGSYPVGAIKLADSPEVKLALADSNGSARLTAILAGEALDIQLKNSFTNVSYEVDSKSKVFKEMLQSIVASIPVVELNAAVSGTWSKMKFNINSNLGTDLGNGFKKQIEAKVEEARKKLKALIDDKIKGQRDKLTADFNKAKSQVTGVLDEKKKQLDQAKKDTENQVKSQQKGAGGDKKKLLKSLGF